MGFTPQQIRAMTLWEFIAARHGWELSTGRKSEPGMTAEEYYKMLEISRSLNW